MMLPNGDGKAPVLGPAGDVVQILRLKDSNDIYKGTALSDAQLLIAKKKSEAIQTGMSKDDLFANYGSTNIPEQVRNWMDGSGTYAAATEGATWVCAGDAMSHFNKGVVGLRLEFVTGVTLQDIKIKSLTNRGKESQYKGIECGQGAAAYQGADVRGVSIGAKTTLTMSEANAQMPAGVTFDAASCRSVSGSVKAFVDTGTSNVNQASLLGNAYTDKASLLSMGMRE
jgi:hypothetical protein